MKVSQQNYPLCNLVVRIEYQSVIFHTYNTLKFSDFIVFSRSLRTFHCRHPVDYVRYSEMFFFFFSFDTYIALALKTPCRLCSLLRNVFFFFSFDTYVALALKAPCRLCSLLGNVFFFFSFDTYVTLALKSTVITVVPLFLKENYADGCCRVLGAQRRFHRLINIQLNDDRVRSIHPPPPHCNPTFQRL
jgi:hypothetical protein